MPTLKGVVLDTNTLVSGLLWDGNEAKVIEKAERHEIRIFISHDLLKGSAEKGEVFRKTGRQGIYG